MPASAGQRWQQESLECSEDLEEVFFLFFFHLTHASSSTSISTRASAVTFWLEASLSVGRGEGLLEPSAAAACCLQQSLDGGSSTRSPRMVKERPPTIHMGDSASQLPRKVHPGVCFSSIFVSLYLHCTSVFFSSTRRCFSWFIASSFV